MNATLEAAIASAAVPLRSPLGTQDLNQLDATQTLQHLQADARRNAMLARTLPKGASKIPGSSASLQAAAAKGTPRQITIYLVPMTAGGTRTEAARILANITRTIPEDMLVHGKLLLVFLVCHSNPGLSRCIGPSASSLEPRLGERLLRKPCPVRFRLTFSSILLTYFKGAHLTSSLRQHRNSAA